MNLDNIEVYANQTCFNTDPHIKFQAEAAFREFVATLDISQFPSVMENFSETVLFVFLSLLDKTIPKSSHAIQIFKQLKDMAIKWHLPNGEFKRPYDSQYLVSYATNTLGMVLGKCMKQIYLVEKSKNDLIQYLKLQSNSLFKLFLYQHFIEAVSTIDEEMEFVAYRTLVYSFQEKMIPLFLQQLYPYFISVTDRIKINELGSMLPTLSDKSRDTKQFELFRGHEEKVSQVVFKLLSQIVGFKFNITFSEFDFDGEIEHCMISFPQSVLNHLISKQFLEAFYFMLEKMLSVNFGGQYFEVSFECLKKILLSKLTHLSKPQRAHVMQLHYTGLFRLLQTNISSPRAMTHLFECLFKFIHAFDFTLLQQHSLNHLQLCQLIKEKTLLVINLVELQIDNPLLKATCELASKVASQFISMSQQKHTLFYQQFCKDFYQAFFEAYITKDYDICAKANVQKINSLVTILNDFFHHVNKVGSMDIGFMFRLILSRSQETLVSKNAVKIANFLFLVTQISDQAFFDCNLFYQATTDQDLRVLGNLIHRIFEYINEYSKGGLSDKRIEVGILMFFQKILSECLSNLTNSQNSIVISSMTYKVINLYSQIKITDEDFLLYCFNELGKGLYSEDYQKVQYVLDVYYSMLLKIKWCLKRQFFTQSAISKQILHKTIELSKDALQSTPALLKQRRKLFKIITILSFDDLKDSFRTNIDFVIQAITLDFNNNQLSKIVFDLSGICENIETAVIYRYFLDQLDKKIGLQLLIKTLYETFGHDTQMLEQVVWFNCSLINDKSLRMSSKQLSPFIYDIIEHSLHFLTIVLDVARNGVWSDVLNQTLTMANLLCDSSYINLFLIKRKCADKFFAFLQKLTQNLLANHCWAADYPELSNTLYETYRVFLTNCIEVILAWKLKSPTFEQYLSKFILVIQSAMHICIKSLQTAAESGKNFQISEKFIETISKLYSFLRYKRIFMHQQHYQQFISKIQVQNQEQAVNFLQSLYRVSMTNIKNISRVLNGICICIMEVSYFYPMAYRQIFKALGVSQQGVGRIERIFRNIQNFNEDPLFISNLREWLSKSENHYDAQIQY